MDWCSGLDRGFVSFVVGCSLVEAAVGPVLVVVLGSPRLGSLCRGARPADEAPLVWEGARFGAQVVGSSGGRRGVGASRSRWPVS